MLDRFSNIILHQAELMENFRAVELQNGFIFPNHPIDLQSYEGQQELRRLAWCIQEELCEASEALDSSFGVGDQNVRKELIDALHYIAEFMLTLGYWPSDLPSAPRHEEKCLMEGVAANLFQTMIHLGLVMNLLKNKPHKQTRCSTDPDYFKERLSRFIRSFVYTCYACGMTDESIENTYFEKASENQQRIDTGV